MAAIKIILDSIPIQFDVTIDGDQIKSTSISITTDNMSPFTSDSAAETYASMVKELMSKRSRLSIAHSYVYDFFYDVKGAISLCDFDEDKSFESYKECIIKYAANEKIRCNFTESFIEMIRDKLGKIKNENPS